MYVVNQPSVVFDKEDQQLIEDFENLATALDDDLCSKIGCENCPCHAQCNELFKQRPLTEMYKIIDFFRNFPTEEG